MAMLGVNHPFTGALYEQDGEGHIKVTKKDGSWGLFKTNGQWVSGDVRECDAQLCNWVGGPQFRNMRLKDISKSD
jgi:hypothetical protein